ncbi:MFS transporter [Kyrpidia spormannii]|uniref:MFS transporter n=1 Tax=Kyrpidia spormannii TaxID=2055160 RepID=UPI002F263A95
MAALDPQGTGNALEAARGTATGAAATVTIYAGLLFSMLFMERVARRIGFRMTVCAGLGAAALSALLFPTFQEASVWLVLRFVLGTALGAVHYGTQTWLGLLADPARRGRQMALYGFSTGVGFAVGPLGVNTLLWGEPVPFLFAAGVLLAAGVPILRIQDVRPDPLPHEPSLMSGRTRLCGVPGLYRSALPALALPFAFGFMESAFNAGLPLYAASRGWSLSGVSLALSLFVIGSLIFQMPLGWWSDRFGRGKTLIVCSAVGAALLITTAYASSTAGFSLGFGLAGAAAGSLFSLSLAYLQDLVDGRELPRANRLAVIHFGAGMVAGPMGGTFVMSIFGPDALFWIVAGLFLLYTGGTTLWSRRHRNKKPARQHQS